MRLFLIICSTISDLFRSVNQVSNLNSRASYLHRSWFSTALQSPYIDFTVIPPKVSHTTTIIQPYMKGSNQSHILVIFKTDHHQASQGFCCVTASVLLLSYKCTHSTRTTTYARVLQQPLTSLSLISKGNIFGEDGGITIRTPRSALESHNPKIWYRKRSKPLEVSEIGR